MAVVVAGLWELGWNTPIAEIDLWEYPLRDFGVSELHMAPVSGLRHPMLREHADLGEVIEQARADGLRIVFVDERGTEPLRSFVHPEDALYVCGKASESPMPTHSRPGDLSVRVETAVNRGMLWPHQVIAVVLYDRLVKSWR